MRDRDIKYKLVNDIFDAVQDDDLEKMELLFTQTEMNIEDLEQIHLNILIEAATRLYRTQIIEFLLQKGANPNFIGREQETPLSIAATEGKTHIVKLLLDNGADIDFPEQAMRHTALNLAVMNDHFETAEYLLKQNANPNIANQEGFTPLFRTLKAGYNVKMLQLLLDHGADVNVMKSEEVSVFDFILQSRASATMISEVIIHSALNQSNAGQDWQKLQQNIASNPKFHQFLTKECVTILASVINDEALVNSIVDNFNHKHPDNIVDRSQITPLDARADGKQLLKLRSRYSQNQQKTCELLSNSTLMAEFIARNNLMDHFITGNNTVALVETLGRIGCQNENDDDKKISNILSKITPEERDYFTTSLSQKASVENEVSSLKDQALIYIIKNHDFPQYELPSRAMSPQHLPENLVEKGKGKRDFDEMNR